MMLEDILFFTKISIIVIYYIYINLLFIYRPREHILYTYTRTQTFRARITMNSFFTAYVEKYTKHMNALLFFMLLFHDGGVHVFPPW
jgi:hypothetical protein